jgi:LCP family protein required for cell wall assembly
VAVPSKTAQEAKNVWLAAALSAMIPGAGQLYARQYLRAALWFLPVLFIGGGLIPITSMRTVDLVGAALSPTVLWSIFGVNILATIWRIGSSVDAFVVTRDPDAVPSNAIALGVGWAFILALIIFPHIALGRYSYDAIRLVDSVFVTAGEAPPIVPIVPIGTDADIVADPEVHNYDAEVADPRSNRNLIFRSGFGDPDAVASWPDIVAGRNDSGPAPFLEFNDRVDADRITILFAGGDAGPGRGGLRTDSMMVGSIDTVTGKAALFGLPRNMAQIPLPRRFASAFSGLEQRLAPPAPPLLEGEVPPVFQSCRCFPEQLNAVYPFTRKWTGTYPDEIDPGMAALRDVLENLMGINIDYYALIDMAAFVDLVEAIGGVDVLVLSPLESEVSPPREGDPWAKVDVDVGWNHLSGPEALAYARARKGSSDYTRMARQRCMVKAVAAKADAFTLLRSFPAIVDALDGSVVTDLPVSFVPDLMAATAGLGFEDIETVGLTHSYWLPERDHKGHPVPDVGKIRSKVGRVLAGQSSTDGEFAVSEECEA